MAQEHAKAQLKYFSHDRCNVCKVLLPKIKELIEAKYPLLKLEYINIEENPQVAAEHQVFTAPTTLVFFDDKEYYRFARNLSIQQLDEAIERPYNLLF